MESIGIDRKSSGGGSGSSDPILTKLAQYGTLVAKTIEAARDAKQFDELDAYRALKLKPMYVERLVEASQERVAEFGQE